MREGDLKQGLGKSCAVVKGKKEAGLSIWEGNLGEGGREGKER